MTRFGKSFGKDICQLVKSKDMRQSYLFSNNMLTDEVAINLNVLRSFMKDGIVCNSGSTDVVSMKRRRATNSDTEFTEKTAEPDNFSTRG